MRLTGEQQQTLRAAVDRIIRPTITRARGRQAWAITSHASSKVPLLPWESYWSVLLHPGSRPF